ncbi:MAG: type II secretion system protein N [Halioglobus sp.]
MRLLRLAGGLALVLVFIAVLIATAPARLLTYLLPDEQIVLAGVDGTLWRGRASRAMLQLPPGYLHLGAVNWSLDPVSLLLFAPRIRVESAWGGQVLEGELRVRGNRDIDLKNFEMQIAADLVQRFAPLAVDGLVSAHFEQLALRDGLPHSARGRLVWQDAGFQSPRGRIALGSYAVDLAQVPGEALVGEVLTLGGALRAEGRVELRGRAYDIDIALHGDGPLDSELTNALALMATPQGEGYRIRLQSTF